MISQDHKLAAEFAAAQSSAPPDVCVQVPAVRPVPSHYSHHSSGLPGRNMRSQRVTDQLQGNDPVESLGGATAWLTLTLGGFTG